MVVVMRGWRMRVRRRGARRVAGLRRAGVGPRGLRARETPPPPALGATARRAGCALAARALAARVPSLMGGRPVHTTKQYMQYVIIHQYCLNLTI